MPNEILFPYIGPQHWTKLDPNQAAAYVSRFMDEFRFRDTIRSFEQKVCYIHKWQQTDTIKEQFISNYGPLSVQLKDEDGKSVGPPVSFTTGQQDFFRPGYYLRTVSLPLGAVDPGYYYWQLTVGSSDVWVTDPFEVVEEALNTLYTQYKHYERYGDVLWETGIELNLRIPAILEFKAPGSKDTLYEDQPLNETMVRARPFRLFDLIIGDAKGVPPWLIDKINWILGCSDVKFDGRYFTKNEGAKLEENKTDLYPMAGYTIEMREKLNRSSVSYEDDSAVVSYGYAVAVINTKGFGTGTGDYVEITDVN